MNLKKFSTLLAACLFSTCLSTSLAHAEIVVARVEADLPSTTERSVSDYFVVEGWAGNYLSGRFGQQHHDWDNASQYMSLVLGSKHDDPTLLKRAMILAMGSGNADAAFELARNNMETDDDHSLSLIFLTAEAFKKKQYEQASKMIGQIPESGIADFITPLLQSWSDAAQGKYNTENLTGNTIHIHHAILIADYLDNHEQINKLLEKATASREDIPPNDMERIADLYAHIGQTEKAKQLYAKALEVVPENTQLIDKIRKINAGEDMHIFEAVKNPAMGVALAFYDTANTLHMDYNDDSARLFAHLAHYLNPEDTNSKLLLSEITALHERYDEAIAFLKSVPQTDEEFINAQRRIAELYIESERTADALHTLQFLVDKFENIDAMIQIGDIQRREEDFKQALKAYNLAAKKLGKEIPDDYWHLYYMRGICYERLGEWAKAEKELQAALAIEPEHPFVLNYLGYAWADQGVNLKQSLEMIERAVALRPADGYITDSLGWVLYRMGRHDESVPHLEKAVELLPYDPVINDHLGDAYWSVGRKLEARFQWERAKNHSEDAALLATIDEKLNKGLASTPVLREAKSDQLTTDEIATP